MEFFEYHIATLQDNDVTIKAIKPTIFDLNEIQFYDDFFRELFESPSQVCIYIHMYDSGMKYTRRI